MNIKNERPCCKVCLYFYVHMYVCICYVCLYLVRKYAVDSL